MKSNLSELLTRLTRKSEQRLYFVVPGTNWVLDWVAHYVTKYVHEQFGLRTGVIRSAHRLRGQIVHYGSLWDLVPNIGTPHMILNRSVGTIFHGQRDVPGFSEAIKKLLDNQRACEKIHTASRIMETRLLEWGVPSEKIVRIPLGVDLNRFKLATPDQRARARRDLGIGDEVFCIGSFHKDGQGMDEGDEPKMIKGPDVFLHVVEQLNKRYPIFVLLSAPARGYVKRGLEKIGVKYVHVRKQHFHEIPPLYHVLDLYLITSREEGGPEGVLESMASGIPLVTTKVGLAPDVVVDRKNGLLVDVEDVAGLTKAVSELIEGKEFRERLVSNALQTIVEYDWKKIAEKYYRLLYEPILANETK